MNISYKKLFKLLVDKEMKPATLSKETGIAPSTMHKLRKNELVALEILIRICTYFKCQLNDIAELEENSFTNEKDGQV